MLMREILAEGLADWRSGRWVHYSDHPMLSFNYTRRFHQDPLGLYFFPEEHDAVVPLYRHRRYRFTAALKPETNVLDVATMTEDDLDRLIDAAGPETRLQYDDARARWPENSIVKRFDSAWSIMTQTIGAYGRGAAVWNRAIRSCGWDAVFDDTGSIHVSEPQLLVLNPRVITDVRMELQRTDAFAQVQKVVDDLVEVCRPFGEVEATPVRRSQPRWGGGPRISAQVDVRRGQDNYADFEVHLDTTDRHRFVNIGMRWSRPSLGYGVGASYILGVGYQFDGLKSVERALERIFAAQEAEAT